MSQSLSKNDFLKNNRSERHSNYYDFVTNRVGTRSQIVIRGRRFWRPAMRKLCSKGAFSKTMKIEHGTNKYSFIRVRHWDRLKMVPGGVFWKTWKSNEKMNGKPMFFYGPKPLTNIEKTETFLDFGWSEEKKEKEDKSMPKEIAQVTFLGPKWRHVRPRFDLSLDFWSLGVMPKNDDFWMLSRWPPKSEKSV